MADEKKLAPPYLAFKTFKNRITGLAHEGRLPGTIDTSLFGTDSGGTQAQLMSAFRFLYLIDDGGKPLDHMSKMASGDANVWKSTLKELIDERYSSDQLQQLAEGTPQSIRQAFGEYDLKASSLDKIVRFLVAAAEDSGIPVSKHISSGNRPVQRRATRKKTRQNASNLRSEERDTEESIPEGMISTPIHLPRRDDPAQLVVPKDISSAEIQLIKHAVDALDLYVKAREQD